MRETSDKLIGIQAARGVAALLVALLHGGHNAMLPQYVGYVPFGGFFNFGHAGVDFFFVLSGFIIYYVHYGDLGDSGGLTRYLWRRVTRIYPPYWIVTTFIVLRALLRPGDDDLSLTHLLTSIFLIHWRENPLVGVAWTLEHEVLFYAVFATAIFNLRIGGVIFTAWALLILAGLGRTWNSDFLRFASSEFNLQFFMGMACAHIVLTRRIRWPLVLAVAGIAGFVATGIMENADILAYSSMPGHLLFGLASSVIIVGLATAELRGSLRIGSVGTFLGASSYALYLLHPLAIGASAKALAYLGIGEAIPGWSFLLFNIACAVAAAGLFYLLIERPIIQRLQDFGRNHVYRARPQAVGRA